MESPNQSDENLAQNSTLAERSAAQDPVLDAAAPATQSSCTPAANYYFDDSASCGNDHEPQKEKQPEAIDPSPINTAEMNFALASSSGSSFEISKERKVRNPQGIDNHPEAKAAEKSVPVKKRARSGQCRSKAGDNSSKKQEKFTVQPGTMRSSDRDLLSRSAEENSSQHLKPRKKVPQQPQRRNTPTSSLEEDSSTDGNLMLATAGHVTLGENGNSQLGKNKRRRKTSSIATSGSGDSPNSKAAPAVLQSDRDFAEHKLEQKRLSSRLSSRRSQELKKYRVEHLRTEKKRLETANDALRKENTTIHEAIRNQRAAEQASRSPLHHVPVLSSFSSPAANVNTTDSLTLLRAAVGLANPSTSGLYSGLHNSNPLMFSTQQRRAAIEASKPSNEPFSTSLPTT
jgi:hypothetical protein